MGADGRVQARFLPYGARPSRETGPFISSRRPLRFGVCVPSGSLGAGTSNGEGSPHESTTGQPIASLTGLPTRLSISTSVSMVNLAVFLFTTSDTRGRETIKISAASACFK